MAEANLEAPGVNPVQNPEAAQTSTTPKAAAPNRSKPARPEWLKALMPGLLVAVVCGLFASAFLWPMSQMAPKDISLAIAGPEAQVAQIEQALTAQQEDLFLFTELDDRAAVEQAIAEREVLGGIAIGADGVEFMTASAGNAQVTQMLGQVAAGMKENGPLPVTVTDVVGGGNAFAGNLSMLPALIGGMMGGMLSIFMVRRPAHRIITISVGAIGVGLVGAAVLGPWFDLLPGSYWLNALALGGAALAISGAISGFGSLLGKAGAGLGVILVMLIGTPWGGVMVPSEFLPGTMATIGSHMPTGTLVNLIKSINYFPEAATSGQWWTLAIWAVAGMLLILIGTLIHARKAARKIAA
ncbi:ABC transporter permease [Leucobacter sp. cx-42]|uniref:ABC transporter permease n=1 Tax=unclassified Leucobacter TaxID=2621730 RepID=UPI00165E7CD7|nr:MULTISPECIES: ABC transporter permease [unclassified Leucobacter]MBC9954053.1 ABC transporter permease [Leucobacter sp. cx-42]